MLKTPFGRGLVVILIASFLVGGLVFFNRILAGDVFSKEEAQHALYGFWLYKDIKGLNWDGFWYDTSRQMVWPFLHSWILSLFFLLGGVSFVSARTLSLLLFLGTVIVMYLLANKLCDREGWKVGLVAALLALTSPMMISFASQNMLEGLGAFLFVLAVDVYLICEEYKVTLGYLILSLIIGMMIYTNYLYAYLVIPAFLIGTISKLAPLGVEAYGLSRKGEKAAIPFIWWTYRKLIVLLVLLTLAGIWFSFSFSRKVLLLFNSIFKYSGGAMVPGAWANLVYYPKVLIANLSFSPWLGIFLLLALIMPFTASRFRGLNKLYVYIWTVMLLLTLTIPAKAPQLIYVVVPFIFIVFAGVAVYLEEKLWGVNKSWAVGLAVAIFLPSLFSLPNLAGQLFPQNGRENMGTVLLYFKSSVPPDKAAAFPVNIQSMSGELLDFYFADRKAPIVTDVEKSDEEIFDEARTYLSVELDRESKYQQGAIDDSGLHWNNFLKEKESKGEIARVSCKRFDSIGVTACIYNRIIP